MAQRYWILGPGRLGLSLGSVLIGANATNELLLVGRRAAPPPHSVFKAQGATYVRRLPGPPPPDTRLLLTVPDGSIGTVASELAGLGAPGKGCVALHFSGAQTAEALASLAERGYAVGSLHPLQTIADAERGAERLAAARFTFEGDSAAREAASLIVKAAGGRMLEVRAADKARYHAACVFASNYLVACAAVATRLLADAADISRSEAAEALQPLCWGAVANLELLGLPRALTGPISRGDLETVKRHLASLDGATRVLYAELASQALDLSVEQGLDAEVAKAIESEIRGLNATGSST